MIAENWDIFMQWNDAIAEACFPELDEPEPVYLDLDEEIQRAICLRVGAAPELFGEALGTAVRDVLILGRGSERVFQEIEGELLVWRKARRTDDPPPVLPLLAAFSLAAQRMASGGGMRDTNYYSRLMEVLGAPKAREEVSHAYRDLAEALWGSLNTWLKQVGGRRGTPTATAVGGHRYVGIPLSQALIRRAERQKMLRFFADMGLPAGAHVPDSELQRLFAYWLRREPSPSPALARLWDKEALRPRVSDALRTSLEQWDGRAEASATAEDTHGRVRLTLAVGTFPRRAVSIGALIFLDRASAPRRARITSAEHEPLVELTPAIPGALAVGEGIDNRHLLESVFALHDGLTDVQVERLPTRLVMFRYDENSARWIETEGVLMGEELRLVCRDDLYPALESVLAASARPGWRELARDMPGMPAGWRVLDAVQIFLPLAAKLPARSEELNKLDPVVTTQLLLSGGLRLPRVRGGWHRAKLPEVRALVPTSPGFRMVLVDCHDGQDHALQEWDDAGTGQLVVDLADLELATGTYRLDLVLTSGSDPASTRTFSVHDSESLCADEPDVRLVHDLDDPLTVLGVFRNEDAEIRRWHEGGETAPSDVGLVIDETPPPHPWWSGELRPAVALKQSVSLRPLDPASCLFTGAHHWVIDPAEVDSQGRLLRAKSHGRCTLCGLEKTYSNSYWRNRRSHLRQQRGEQAPPGSRSRPGLHVPRARAMVDDLPWDTLVDALAFLGEGAWSDLVSLVQQVDGSGPAVFQVAHTLEALGFLEIDRDADTFHPVMWNVTPAVLVQGVHGQMLVGRWTPNRARAAARRLNATLARRAQDGPATYHLKGDGAATSDGVVLAGRSWESLAERLPLLSDVAAELPRRPLIHTGNFQWFHVPSASWVPAESLAQTGAFRVRSFTTLDLFRGPEDVRAGTVAVSQVRFSKHAAALVNAGRPLLAFDPNTRRMTVPLGADLPGLYNRAVVLATGHLPRKEGRHLVYEDVPADLASHLCHLLSH